MRDFLSHVRDTGIPTCGKEHAYLRIVLAEGGMALCFTPGNVYRCAGIIGAAWKYIVKSKNVDGLTGYTDFT